MIERINPWVEGKRVLLLGFGREGQSTWRLLRRLGTCRVLDIADQSAPPAKLEAGTRWITGAGYQSCLDDYDVVFKSPGIVLEKPIEAYRCRIVSQTEVFFRCFRDQIIGITGTKGKSTTTTLIHHLLKTAGFDTLLAGNIGIPAFDHIEEVGAKTKIVFELSCHQLEYMTVSPHIGLLINLHEEHLDHYGTMEKYVQAKYHIFSNQRPDDVLLCNIQCLPPAGMVPGRLITAAGADWEEELAADSAYSSLKRPPASGALPPADMAVVAAGGRAEIHYEGHVYNIPVDQIRLLGRHNYFDIGAAYVVCRLLGMDDAAFTAGLKSYEPLPHRLQYLGEYGGVRYYDDSISTICDTTIQALKTLPDADSVLIGGMDRGIDYRELIEFLSQCQIPHIILMEATGRRIYEEIRRDYPGFGAPQRLKLAEHLEDAAELAKRLTRPGHSCVLSPAAASYGIFKNFEERGAAFARLVTE